MKYIGFRLSISKINSSVFIDSCFVIFDKLIRIYMLIIDRIYLPDIHFVFPFGIEQLQLFATDDGDMVANITF